VKAITYGQLRDALDQLIKSGARKATDPLHLNGQYWQEIVDCRAKTRKKLIAGCDQTTAKVIARGRVKVKPRPPEHIQLV